MLGPWRGLRLPGYISIEGEESSATPTLKWSPFQPAPLAYFSTGLDSDFGIPAGPKNLEHRPFADESADLKSAHQS